MWSFRFRLVWFVSGFRLLTPLEVINYPSPPVTVLLSMSLCLLAQRNPHHEGWSNSRTHPPCEVGFVCGCYSPVCNNACKTVFSVRFALCVAATFPSRVLFSNACKTLLLMVGLAKLCAFDGGVSKTIGSLMEHPVNTLNSSETFMSLKCPYLNTMSFGYNQLVGGECCKHMTQFADADPEYNLLESKSQHNFIVCPRAQDPLFSAFISVLESDGSTCRGLV